MDATRFDAVSRFLARRRLSRRRALAQGGVGLAAAGLAAAGLSAAAAQDATPPPAAPDPESGPAMLFLQSFRSGSVAPKEGTEGRYTITLEQGLGQTVYFSDRPDRLVGATPTDRFLEGLGFSPDNPPNAALVVETGPGETDIAVVELFAPVYDPAERSVTYEAAVLADWEDSVELGFSAAPTDLATLEPTFGPAHLFIDDFMCSSTFIGCVNRSAVKLVGKIPASEFQGYGYDPVNAMCIPIEPWHPDPQDAVAYWSDECNIRFASGCNGDCLARFNLL